MADTTRLRSEPAVRSNVPLWKLCRAALTSCEQEELLLLTGKTNYANDPDLGEWLVLNMDQQSRTVCSKHSTVREPQHLQHSAA